MKDGLTMNTDQAMAILLVGEAGVGKTTLAMEWPAPFFCLADKNIKFAAELAKKRNKPFYYLEPEFDAAGQPLARSACWTRSLEVMRAAGKDPKVKTLVDDGLQFLSKYLRDHVIQKGSGAEKPLLVGGEAAMTRSMWDPFFELLRQRVLEMRLFGKPYIMTAHLTSVENEVSKILEYQVAVGGKSKDSIASWFNEVWQLDKEPVPVTAENPRGERYIIRTAVTPRLRILRTTMGLPPVFEPATSPEFKKLLASISGTNGAV